ncbi:hypothetical protein UPYG_G00304450 [Umbra pygmaea]|uniref:Uncharacterized protein n=1 Tax=Umbra pygmaea TaxID=75934 RepID=A0ABD0VZK6_UMBPY
MGCSSSSTHTVDQEKRPGTKPDEANGDQFVRNGHILEDTETIADQMQLPVQADLPDDFLSGGWDSAEEGVSMAMEAQETMCSGEEEAQALVVLAIAEAPGETAPLESEVPSEAWAPGQIAEAVPEALAPDEAVEAGAPAAEFEVNSSVDTAASMEVAPGEVVALVVTEAGAAPRENVVEIALGSEMVLEPEGAVVAEACLEPAPRVEEQTSALAETPDEAPHLQASAPGPVAPATSPVAAVTPRPPATEATALIEAPTPVPVEAPTPVPVEAPSPFEAPGLPLIEAEVAQQAAAFVLAEVAQETNKSKKQD